MSFDQPLRQAFEAFADRLRDETRRQLATMADELGDAFETELGAAAARAAAEAKTAAEQAAAVELLAAIAAADARNSEALATAQSSAREARELGRQEGRE